MLCPAGKEVHASIIIITHTPAEPSVSSVHMFAHTPALTTSRVELFFLLAGWAF